MTVERALRALAGFFVLLSLALGYRVHPGAAGRGESPTRAADPGASNR